MTTFTFGGTNLSTFGNITVIDGYLDLPERRGSNLVIPYKHGTVFTKKYYDERSITFGIAVTELTLANLETKLNTMRALFSPLAQQTLSIVFEDATTKTVQATVDKPLQVTRTLTLARVVVEFTLCEPFFRLSSLIADNTTIINSAPEAMTVNNTGTIEERDATFLLTGPLTNVVITNATAGGTLTYTGVIDGGETVTIGTLAGEYYATHNVDGNVVGNLSHSGHSALMVFLVGNNTLSIASDVTTTGTIRVSFYPPFV